MPIHARQELVMRHSLNGYQFILHTGHLYTMALIYDFAGQLTLFILYFHVINFCKNNVLRNILRYLL